MVNKKMADITIQKPDKVSGLLMLRIVWIVLKIKKKLLLYSVQQYILVDHLETGLVFKWLK
jgi:hypothetical protein